MKASNFLADLDPPRQNRKRGGEDIAKSNNQATFLVWVSEHSNDRLTSGTNQERRSSLARDPGMTLLLGATKRVNGE